MKLRYVFLIPTIILVTSTASARWFQDKEFFQTESFGEVVFSHDNHLEAVGSNCETCHNDIFNIVTKKNPTYTMADMQQGKSCGACHNGKRAFSVDKDCMSCHSGDVTWEKENIGETLFSHSIHIGMDYTCDVCHPDLFKAKRNGQKMTMAAMNKGEFCGACHDGSTAFSVKKECASCHTGAVDLTWHKDNIGETKFSHSVHLGMDYSCGECHPDLFKPKHKGQELTMAAMNKGEFCGACHDGSTAFSVQKDCASCHAGDLKWRNDDAGETQFSHSAHLGMDYGCGDCHPDLFKPKHPGQDMKMEAMNEGAYCGACHDGSTAFSVQEDCESCHKMK